MPLIFEPGVNSDGLHDQMWRALGGAEALYRLLADGKDCHVTALLNGRHNPGSLHPKGMAADLSVHNLSLAEHLAIVAALHAMLFPQGYDVVDEKPNATAATTGAHIHIEFDPKPGRDQFVRRL